MQPKFKEVRDEVLLQQRFNYEIGLWYGEKHSIRQLLLSLYIQFIQTYKLHFYRVFIHIIIPSITFKQT